MVEPDRAEGKAGGYCRDPAHSPHAEREREDTRASNVVKYLHRGGSFAHSARGLGTPTGMQKVPPV